jgi:hypothetical protein
MSPWRASNLAASLGSAWDGDWWLDDVDVAIFTLPTLDNLKDSDASMRVLTAAYAQHISSRRREARRLSMLLFDEFGSLAGGRALPAELAALARSERTPEGAWSFPGGADVPPDRVTVTERHRARLNQDQVRAARVGEAQIIAAAGSNGPGSSRRRSRQKRIRASKRSYHMDLPALWRLPWRLPST